MHDIAITLVNNASTADAANWENDPQYVALMKYVYQSGIWDKQYRSGIRGILQKEIAQLTPEEINTYLTFIFGTERIQQGCVEAHIQNGVLLNLMKRYLELEE